MAVVGGASTFMHRPLSQYVHTVCLKFFLEFALTWAPLPPTFGAR